MTRRVQILALLVGVALVAAVIMSYQFMLDQQEAAVAANTNLAEGLSMIDQITEVSRRPAMAVSREKLSTETTTLIEAAAKSAGIREVKRITSDGAPRRIGDTVYKEKPTQVLLQQVTLKQIVDLALAVTGNDVGLNVESIRLSVPPEGGNAGLWNAEIVLTYLIYAPPQAGLAEPK